MQSNRYKGTEGTGAQALSKMKLEEGVYILGGYYEDRSVGHCVVLEVHSDSISVHEEKGLNGPEALNWLHEIAFVRRVKEKRE